MSIASGEWWIDESGMAQYADGDVGDQNHAGMALDNILAQYDINLDEEPDAPVIDPYSLSADAKRWLRKKGMPAKAIKMIDGGDPREYMIEHNGWIRLAGTAAELWTFDDATLGSLRSGVYEAWEGDAWDDIDPGELDFDVLVEEAKTRRTFAIPLTALMDDRMDAESLKRLGAEGEIVQAPSAPELRAAWGRKAARERGLEENPQRKQRKQSMKNKIERTDETTDQEAADQEATDFTLYWMDIATMGAGKQLWRLCIGPENENAWQELKKLMKVTKTDIESGLVVPRSNRKAFKIMDTLGKMGFTMSDGGEL